MVLRAWLEQQKMTQAEFAKRIGSDQGHVSDLVSGKVSPKLASMQKIYEATAHAVGFADWVPVKTLPKPKAPARAKRVVKARRAAR